MAHTLDTTLRSAAATTAPRTQAYTCGAGTTVLVLGIACGSTVARAGGAPTYNGVTMTQGDTRRVAANEVACEIWYLLNPPTGSSLTISIPNTGTAINLALEIASFKAATGYTSLYDVGNGNTAATSASPTQLVTTTVNGDAVYQIGCHQANNLGTISYSHTQIGATDHGAWSSASQYALQATLGNITMTLTNQGSAATNNVTSVVSFKETLLRTVKTVQDIALATVKTAQGITLETVKTFGSIT